MYLTSAGVSVGTDLPQINVTGSASIRLRVFELICSFSGSPADVATLFKLVRTTDAGTGGTSLTINGDPLGPTTGSTAKKGTFSTPPTDSADLLRFALNQRAPFKWYGNEGQELKSVAASAAGVMLNSESSGGTPTCESTIRWIEG